ncbi:MAG: WecB/TagA/CpsF family glycosyltransferase [Verrucomicrobiia bacterium]|jgi:N-acetylglucosaminyldiphosphoundecaprenol N-acetyl-beta-D-mannosaminyltransferase
MNKTSVMPPLSHRYILGTRVDATSYGDAAARIVQWAQAGESRYICACNVHMVMEAHDVEDFQRVVNAADLVTPDGMPLVWVLRRLGLKNQARVYGPDLTLAMCAAAAAAGIPVGLYGGTQEALDTLQTSYRAQFPQLQITYAYSPPFRPMTREEDDAVVQAINASGARILFVGLGCPKQEFWVAGHRDRVQAVMLAVGAAFDFHSARVKQAPQWMQRCGLEWLFRLLMDPHRLWRRYFKNNPRFLWLVLCQLLGGTDNHRVNAN